MTTSDLSPYQSDHLILLVGGNPLPNAVAAQLLAKPRATIWLLHSVGDDGKSGTKQTAYNLETFLRRKNDKWSIKLEPIPSTGKSGIEQRISEILNKGEFDGRIGLHYTGGTKSMSVHTYRALERAFTNSHPRPVFSYLDPYKLALCIDGGGTESDKLISTLKDDNLRHKLEVTPDQLAQLHGYARVPQNTNWAKLEDTPGLLELCQAISQLNSTEKGHLAWKKWVYKEQHKVLPTPTQNPGLEAITSAFNHLCSVSSATPDLVAAKLIPGKPNIHLTNCQDWFRGHWLEEYVLWCVRQAANPFIHTSEKGLNYKATMGKDDFELDVVALIGYQLFVISCITTSEKKEAKEHLLEAFVRARQLGGDEARIALVCCYDDPGRLQSEVSRSWDAAGKVRVLGRDELSDLSQHLADWFQKVN